MSTTVEPGVYRHYKGKEYEVIGVARLEATLDEVVIYRARYAADFPYGQLWVRPVQEFLEHVEHEGRSVPRFSRMEAA